MTIGERIKILRQQKGLRQKELADKIDVGKSTVCNWEYSINEPNPSQRQKLCKFFKISEAELFGAPKLELSSEILEALQDPIALKALLITHKNKQDIKDAIKNFLECLPNLTPEKRTAILALCQ